MESENLNDLSIGFHALDPDEVVLKLKTELHEGLSSEEAAKRLEQCGRNELVEKEGTTFFQMIMAQLSDFVVILLLVAAVISALLGDYVEAAAIMAIVILNTVMGVVQESRAEEALAALRKCPLLKRAYYATAIGSVYQHRNLFLAMSFFLKQVILFQPT